MPDEQAPAVASATAGPAVVVRPEVPSDVEAIFEITRAAFTGLPYADGTEPYIVDALRSAGALTISLVAEVGGRVVGHVAFSPVTLSDGSEGWYGLGPVSVLPDLQRRGVGRALINEGLARLRALGAGGCVLEGNPAYYGRFGFRSLPELTLPGCPPAYFQALPFGDRVPAASVAFHKSFYLKAESAPEPGTEP